MYHQPNTLFGYDRLCIDPLQLGEHWILSVTAQQSREVPLYRLMVINQIEQQAVSWQAQRSMSVSPPASFLATPYFTSQNYFYFPLSEVLVLWAQGWFWCVRLPEVSGTCLKSHVHKTAGAQLQGKGQPRLRPWSGGGVAAGKLRGQLDLYPTGWWGVHQLITRCYCDNPWGTSALKTKYGNVKLKPGEGKKRRQKHERKEKTSATETGANEKDKIHFGRIGGKKSR